MGSITIADELARMPRPISVIGAKRDPISKFANGEAQADPNS